MHAQGIYSKQWMQLEVFWLIDRGLSVQQSSDGLLQSYQSCICFLLMQSENVLLLLLRSVFKLSTMVGQLLPSSHRKLTKVMNYHGGRLWLKMNLCSSNTTRCRSVLLISVYLHVVDMEVLLNDGCGLLAQLFLSQGWLSGGLGRWGSGCLPLRCSHTQKKNQWQSSSTNLNLCEQKLAKVHIMQRFLCCRTHFC